MVTTLAALWPRLALELVLLVAWCSAVIVTIYSLVRILRSGPAARRRLWKIVTFRRPGPPPPP